MIRSADFKTEYYKQIIGGKIIDCKVVEGIPILIIEKTVGNEIFYYEIQVLLSHSE